MQLIKIPSSFVDKLGKEIKTMSYYLVLGHSRVLIKPVYKEDYKLLRAFADDVVTTND